MTTAKHWVHYLPEVGRPIMRKGEAQMEISQRIRDLHEEIRRLEEKHRRGKEELLQDVLQHWTREEVRIAEDAWGAEIGPN